MQVKITQSITLTFVEDTPYAFLLRKQPTVQPRDLFEVCTRADEKQPENQDAIERVY